MINYLIGPMENPRSMSSEHLVGYINVLFQIHVSSLLSYTDEAFPISDLLDREAKIFDFISSCLSTFCQLKMETVSTFNHLKVETQVFEGLYLQLTKGRDSLYLQMVLGRDSLYL